MDDPVLEQHFVGHKGTITSLSFSPNEKQLLSSSEDHTFINWNLSPSSGSLRYQANPLPVNYVCYSPNGNLIASTQGEYVRLWVSTIRGKSIEFKTHFSTVRSVQFSPNGNNLLTASDDKSLKIWVTSKRKFLSSLSGNNGHTNWVRFGTYSSDGHLIVSCSDDKTIKLWDPGTSKLVHTFNEVRGVPRHVNFHPSNTCIGVAMSQGTVKLYDIKMMKLLQYYPCHEGAVNSIAFHPNGTYLISAGHDQTSKIIDLIEGRAILSLEGHQKPVTVVSFSSSGKIFATAAADKNVFVWRTNLNEENWRNNDTLIKESLLGESVSIPRLETTPSTKIKQPDISEVYCAKDYEDQGKETSSTNNEFLNNASLEIEIKSNLCNNIINENDNNNDKNLMKGEEITNSINDLMNQISLLTNKLGHMETRLNEIEELVKTSKGS